MQPTSIAYMKILKIVQNTVIYKPTIAKRTQTQIASRGAAPPWMIGNSWFRQRRHTKKCVSWYLSPHTPMTVHRDQNCNRKVAESQFYSLPNSVTPTLHHKIVLMLVSDHEEKRENSAAEEGRHMLGSLGRWPRARRYERNVYSVW